MSNTEKTTPPRKPMLFAENPFNNDRQDDVEFAEAMWDASYVPGYSEVKKENELRARKGTAQLEHPRLQWVRIINSEGGTVAHSDEGMLEWMKLGYRAVGLDDLENNGWGMPPTAHVGPDGLIRRGDLALFMVGSDRASRNRARQQAEIDESVNRGPMDAGGTLYRPDDEPDEHRSLTPEDLPNL